MAANKKLQFDIFGRDKSASSTMRGVGKTAQQMGDRFKKVGKAIGVGLLAAAAGAVAFAVDSVKAFAEAEESQNRLAFAYSKFPSLQDTTLKSLQKLNTERAKVTRFDDDATASAQAVLAQYKLSGAQLKKLTPLLQDYATATKKDLTTAAKDLGKALMGQGRTLKEVGVNFKDTKTLGGNFDQLMKGLSTTVGGFAEKDAQTANGKLDIMRNRFGEIQETIGEALMPGLIKLMDVFSTDVMPGLEDFAGWFATDGIGGVKDFLGWVDKYKGVLGPAAVAVGGLTAAQWLLNGAMAANPAGLVITFLAAMVAGSALLIANWDKVKGALLPVADVAFGIYRAFIGVALGIAGAMEGVANTVVGSINFMLTAINTLLAFAGLPTIRLGKVDFTSGLKGAKWTQEVLQSSLHGSLSSGGAQIATPGHARAFADGGVVRARPGGIFANIGEGRHDEAVIPLSNDVLSRLGGGGGTQVVIQLQGTYAGSKADLAKTVVSAIRSAVKTGDIPKGVTFA